MAERDAALSPQPYVTPRRWSTTQTSEGTNISTHRRTALISLLLIAVALPNALQAQSPESLAGRKSNTTKSKYEPADLATKSGTVTYVFKGNTGTATIDQVNFVVAMRDGAPRMRPLVVTDSTLLEPHRPDVGLALREHEEEPPTIARELGSR